MEGNFKKIKLLGFFLIKNKGNELREANN